MEFQRAQQQNQELAHQVTDVKFRMEQLNQQSQVLLAEKNVGDSELNNIKQFLRDKQDEVD